MLKKGDQFQDKQEYYDEVKSFYDEKIKQNGSILLAIGNDQPELLDYFSKKYKTVVIKDTLNPGKLYQFTSQYITK